MSRSPSPFSTTFVSRPSSPTSIRSGSIYGRRNSAPIYDPDVPLDHMDDITAPWGRYQTPEQMQASPFYTRISIPVNPSSVEQWRVQFCNSYRNHIDAVLPSVSDASFTLSSVHPIPHRYLRHLTVEHLYYLYEYLFDELWEDHNHGGELDERVSETLTRIRELVLERDDRAVVSDARRRMRMLNGMDRRDNSPATTLMDVGTQTEEDSAIAPDSDQALERSISNSD
ncbi:hypothetical protein BU26DRAFT_567485 [Trematosphaeria pertusa]|uniref:Uncharacterized protein n=1 Tax=Trematosphaeria pertusa TaxID=390896 RepID=A0A6A6I6V9_9PLEO|nr:uncharacterized protein BU26DRAFT_567485 [Trematosphaeria pertusa]KAF2245969.1 hypothetical protein BU26DRAFT_567485 [Trematosphaeria pertusa]